MSILFHATVLSSKEDSASFMSIQKRMFPGKARSTYSPSSAWERSLRPCAARMTVLSGRSHARGGWAAWNLTRGLRPPPACHALRLRFLRRVPCRSACAVFSQVGVSCFVTNFFRFGAGAVLLDSSLIPSPPIMPQDRARVDDP